VCARRGRKSLAKFGNSDIFQGESFWWHALFSKGNDAAVLLCAVLTAFVHFINFMSRKSQDQKKVDFEENSTAHIIEGKQGEDDVQTEKIRFLFGLLQKVSYPWFLND
jgi:hypothetical protein